MSTANETETISPAKVSEELTAEDFAAILATTLALAEEVHIRIGVRNVPPTPLRGEGLMIFIPGLFVDGAGRINTNNSSREE